VYLLLRAGPGIESLMDSRKIIRFIFPFEAVAERLSGRPTSVIWEHQPGKLGTAGRKGLTGEITLEPDLEGIEEIRVFLHEVAHVKNDLTKIYDEAANPDYEPPAPSTRLEANVWKRLADNRETSAWKQSDTWLTWAVYILQAKGKKISPYLILVELLSYPKGRS